MKWRMIINDVKLNKIYYICLMFVFVFIVIMAWQSDDAYHAHRMSWNLVHGNGFVYNSGERVSATTAPLFTLVTTVIYAVSGSVYWSSMLLCLVCSITAIYLMQRRFCKDVGSIITSTCLFLGCTSFISYTTSGLENPMLFLLSGAIVILFLSNETFEAKELLLLAFLSSLLITTRMDNALIVLPLLVYSFLIKSENKPLAVLYGFIGMLPFIIWEIFSIIYYGFPFPNTAYTKLNTGFPLSDYLSRGVDYFFVTGWNDPLVLVAPAVYIFFSFAKKNAKHIVISLGLFLYYAYVVYIGGDFMMGRHFTVPFLISVFCVFDLLREEGILISFKIKNVKITIVKPIAIALTACMLFQCLNINGLFQYVFPERLQLGVMLQPRKIADERAVLYTSTSYFITKKAAVEKGISRSEAMFTVVDSYLMQEFTEGLAAIKKNGYKGDSIGTVMGFMAYQAKDVYLSDVYGLGDPLLVRLPAVWRSDWRIGHMRREVPRGYRESIRTGENRIADPSLHEYYDVLCLITRSEDLFTSERLKAIVDMNLGKYDYLLEEYVERNWTGRYEPEVNLDI